MRMFHEEIRGIVDNFSALRFSAVDGRPRSLVVILRGLPGCGKSTFSMFVKVYAESIGLEAQICCADDYFYGRQGYRFDPEQLAAAHERCQQYCLCALERRVPIVVIDNTNVRPDEWTRYIDFAEYYNQDVCRVSFEVTDDVDVPYLLNRSWHDIPSEKMERRLQAFKYFGKPYAPHVKVDIRDNVLVPREHEASSINHPMERMFFEVIREKIDEFAARRASATGFIAHRCLVFVLRGLPGCGKTTFALQTKIYANAWHLKTIICSSDDYFRGREGFHYKPIMQDQARAFCLNKLRCTVQSRDRSEHIVVVDDANITAAEFGPVLGEARLHDIVFVNFVCNSYALAEAQLARTFTHCTHADRALLPQTFADFNAAKLPGHVDIDPIFNLWEIFITPEQNRSTQR